MHSEFDSEVISSQIFQKTPDLFVFMPFKQAKTCFLKNLHWDIFLNTTFVFIISPPFILLADPTITSVLARFWKDYWNWANSYRHNIDRREWTQCSIRGDKMPVPLFVFCQVTRLKCKRNPDMKSIL